MARFCQVVAAVLCVVVFSAGYPRTWRDITGEHNIRAEYVKFEKGEVHLKRESDGRIIKLAMDKLSRYDQRWVKNRLKKERAGEVPKSSDRTDELDDTPGTSAPSSTAYDWPQWRGKNRDGKTNEVGLLKSWPSSGPTKLWSASGLGKGWASVAVVGDRMYTMGSRNNREYMICLNESDGSQIWVAPVGTADHTNCTPTVDGDLVYGIGLSGDLVCCNAADGKEVWRKNFARDFNGKMMSQWGFSESPLVDGDYLVCTPGGPEAIIAAIEKTTGRVAWTTPLPPMVGKKGKDGAGYSSIVISNGAGVKQYVTLVGRGVIGVAASNGRLLWGYNDIANDTANIPTPLVWDDYVFCSSGYDAGSALLRLSKTGTRIAASKVYFLTGKQMQVHHGGMILHNGNIYCGHGNNNGFPLCINAMNGQANWGPQRGPGSGSAGVTYADGHIYYRYENGIMALVEATPDAFKLKGTFRIATVNGKSWPHPVIANGKLYLRDEDDLHCYDIKQ